MENNLESRVQTLEDAIRYLAKNMNCMSGLPETLIPHSIVLTDDEARMKEKLRKEFWKRYPQGDILFEDYLVKYISEKERK